MNLKVMDYNIRRNGREKDPANLWVYRKDALVSLIQQHSPDILCVQEDKPDQTEVISQALKEYGHYGQYTEDSVDVSGESNTIFYRSNLELLAKNYFWLTKDPSQRGKLDGQGDYFRLVTFVELGVNGQKLSVFNTHFDYKSDAVIYKQAEILAGIVKRPKNYLICGDFNCAITTRPMQFLKKKYILANPETREKTWVDWSDEAHAMAIDFIFSNLKKGNLVVDKTKYTGIGGMQRTPSDHYPIIAEFEI